jgi:hypothetical protein
MRPLVLLAALSACAARPPVSAAPAPPPPVVAPDADVADASAPTACGEPAVTPVTTATAECPELGGLGVVHRWTADTSDRGCRVPAWVLTASIAADATTYFRDVADEVARGSELYHLLTDEEVRAAGLPATNDPVWVFVGDDVAPCQAALGAAWASWRSAEGPMYVEVARAVHGCAFPERAEGPFYALSSAARPEACRYRAMPARTEDAPATLAAVRARIGRRACAAPRCRMRWSQASLTHAGATLDDVQGVYITPDRATPECSWRHDFRHAVTWVPRAGAAPTRLETTGPVAGVFYDGRGLRAAVTAQNGNVDAFALPDGGDVVRAARHAVWYVASEESTNGWTIRPSCL